MTEKPFNFTVLNIKALVHSCDNGEHKPFMLGENGEVLEMMPGTLENVTEFLNEKAWKYDVDVYYTDSCQLVPELKDDIGDYRAKIVPMNDRQE